MKATYSFLNVQCSLAGPGGNLNLGQGAGAAEEGITIAARADINTLTIGADGTPMHSLHADQSGTVTVRLLKTSPVNQALAQMYVLQTASAALHGQNVITLVNNISGDKIICTFGAFKKAPDLTYAKEGGTNEWQFDVGVIVRTLGANA